MYIESCRTKFGCFETGGPGEDLAGECTIHISSTMYENLTAICVCMCVTIFKIVHLLVLDFPEPIKESIQVLRNHIYIPLSDVQIAREEELEKQRYVYDMITI